MDLYYDGFVILADTEKGYAIYADKYMGYFKMSVVVAKFITNKLKENMKHGYFLLDCAEKIYRKKGDKKWK